MKIESHKPPLSTEAKPAGSQKQGVVTNFYDLLRSFLVDPSGKGQDYVPPLAAEDTDLPHFEPCETPTRLIVGIPIAPLPVAMAQTAPLAEATEASQTGAVTAEVESVRSEVQPVMQGAVAKVAGAPVQVSLPSDAQPLPRSTDATTMEAPAQVYPPPTHVSPSGKGMHDTVAMPFEQAVRTEVQPLPLSTDARTMEAPAQVYPPPTHVSPSGKGMHDTVAMPFEQGVRAAGQPVVRNSYAKIADAPVQLTLANTVEVAFGQGVRTEVQPLPLSTDARTMEAPAQVYPPPMHVSPSGKGMQDTVAMSSEQGVRTEAQPVLPSRESKAIDAPDFLAAALGGSANDRPGDIITRNRMPVAVSSGMRAEARTTQPSSSADAATITPPQLGEGTQVHARGTIRPSPPVSEASLQALRVEIVSFVQSPSRPQVTLEIHPPEYGRVLVSGEVDPLGNVAVRLVVENNAVKEHVLLHLQRFPVPAEVEIMTFEEYREHGESRGRERREESPRQPPRRQDKNTTEFSV